MRNTYSKSIEQIALIGWYTYCHSILKKIKINSDDFTHFIKISNEGQFAQKAETWKRGNFLHQFVVSFFPVQLQIKKSQNLPYQFSKNLSMTKMLTNNQTNSHKN